MGPFVCIMTATKYVVKMIEFLRKRYGIKDISFYDDNFLLSRKRVIDFCNLVIKKKIDIVLNLVAPEETIVERLAQRRMCGKCGTPYNLVTIPPKKKNACDKCGSQLIQRKDDEPETVRKRIQVYQQETKPLVEHYKKKKILRDIDASKKPEVIFNSVIGVIVK